MQVRPSALPHPQKNSCCFCHCIASHWFAPTYVTRTSTLHVRTQGSCYALRFGASVVASIVGSVIYNKQNWGWGLNFQQVGGCVGRRCFGDKAVA